MKREQQSYRVTSNLKENTNQEALKIAKIWKLAIIIHLKNPKPAGFHFRVSGSQKSSGMPGFGFWVTRVGHPNVVQVANVCLK